MGAQGPPGKDGLPGKQGEVGPRGIGIKTINISETGGNANLTVTLSDGTEIPLGNIRGPKGDRGADGAVKWADLTQSQKDQLTELLGDIVSRLNSNAERIFPQGTTLSQFQAKLKEFIVRELNNDSTTTSGIFSVDSEFKKWLNKHQESTSLYCANGTTCKALGTNFELQYASDSSNSIYDKEVRLSTRTGGAGSPVFALGMKNGNLRTDGDISLTSGKSIYTQFIRPVDKNSGITLGSNTQVAGNLATDQLQVGQWTIQDAGGALRFLKAGYEALAIHDGGKILVGTGLGVRTHLKVGEVKYMLTTDGSGNFVFMDYGDYTDSIRNLNSIRRI